MLIDFDISYPPRSCMGLTCLGAGLVDDLNVSPPAEERALSSPGASASTNGHDRNRPRFAAVGPQATSINRQCPHGPVSTGCSRSAKHGGRFRAAFSDDTDTRAFAARKLPRRLARDVEWLGIVPDLTVQTVRAHPPLRRGGPRS